MADNADGYPDNQQRARGSRENYGEIYAFRLLHAAPVRLRLLRAGRDAAAGFLVEAQLGRALGDAARLPIRLNEEARTGLHAAQGVVWVPDLAGLDALLLPTQGLEEEAEFRALGRLDAVDAVDVVATG